MQAVQKCRSENLDLTYTHLNTYEKYANLSIIIKLGNVQLIIGGHPNELSRAVEQLNYNSSFGSGTTVCCLVGQDSQSAQFPEIEGV